MKKLLLLLLTIFILSSPVIAQENKVCAYYFYSEHCSHCIEIAPYISEVEANYSLLNLKRLSVDENKNANLLAQFSEKYGIDSVGIPALAIGDDLLMGVRTIRTGLEPAILDHPNGVTCPTSNGNVKPITMLALLGAAAVDAINPCALAVLILLLITIAGANIDNKKKVLCAGIAFTIAVYMSYLFMGFGLFAALQAANVTVIIKKIVGILAILVGVFNIKDFIKLGAGGFVMEVPISWRPKMKEFIKRVTSVPGAFLVGFIVSIFLLPCSSGPYIVILGMLSQAATFWTAVPLLLLYNLIFVSPMILITILVYFGIKPQAIEHMRKPRTRWLHLLAGLVMCILGILLLVGLI